MTKCPFDLQKALAGHPLVTREGKKATHFKSRGLFHGGANYPFQAVIDGGIEVFTKIQEAMSCV
jgi:hypothetical protein